MLNFNKNGTRASGGVSQMIMPSRYRSSLAGGAVVDAVWDCAETGGAKNVTDVQAAASKALMIVRRTKLAIRLRRLGRSSSSSPRGELDRGARSISRG